MPAWKTVLGATKVQEATAFVLSLRGKHVAGKPPQGKTESGVARPGPVVPLRLPHARWGRRAVWRFSVWGIRWTQRYSDETRRTDS